MTKVLVKCERCQNKFMESQHKIGVVVNMCSKCKNELIERVSNCKRSLAAKRALNAYFEKVKGE